MDSGGGWPRAPPVGAQGLILLAGESVDFTAGSLKPFQKLRCEVEGKGRGDLAYGVRVTKPCCDPAARWRGCSWLVLIDV